MEQTILIFAGTTEGRKLAEELSENRIPVQVCVATEYGETLLPKQETLSVRTGRMDEQQITALLLSHYLCVIDATHPYAVLATQNIRQACKETETPYFRLLREETITDSPQLIQVENAEEAAQYLRKTEGPILLTTGTKELDQFVSIPNFSHRIYPRVLPSIESLSRCLELGYSAKNILCMQGPFSKEVNLSLMKQYRIKWLVTKESGRAGGLPEKLDAAKEAGAKVLLIGRPKEETGYLYQELIHQIKMQFSLSFRENEGCLETDTDTFQKTEYFPLFISLKGKRVQVFGGGNIAARRVSTLLPFGCSVELISPELHPDLLEKVESPHIIWKKRNWTAGECSADLVLAATNNRTVNHEIWMECRGKGIPVNAADRQTECDFYFPAIIRSDDLVAGLCSSGTDHAKVRRAAAKIRQVLEENS